MALDFIKKLAGKLLGKPMAAKTAATKADHTKKISSPSRTAAKTHAPSPRTAGEALPRPPSSGERSRDPRREQRPGGERGPRRAGEGHDGRRPRRDDRRDDRRDEQRTGADGSVAAGPSSARAGARSPSRQQHPQQHRGRGSEGRSSVSDTGVCRPGGRIDDEVMAQHRAEHAAWSVDQYQVAPAEGKKRFHDFNLPSEILHGVADMGFQYCTPIQALSLEHALAGKNVAGKAQTGTGKTAAYLVAILTRYLRSPEARQDRGGTPRALVIAPTRELVIQICKDADAVGKYCSLRSLAVYGGMDYERQKRDVSEAPVDLLVATPGRLLDFVRSRVVDLSKVDTLVIDEADRMLDMGFIPDVRSIISRLPPKEKRGTMLYSATLDEDVMRLASQWMEEPVRVEVEGEHMTTKTVKQVVYVVTAREKFTVLYNHIQQYPDSRILIFCNRRSTTEDVAASLTRRGIACEMLSGDVNQNRRLRVLEDFREGKVRIVVATDVAGRGLHVDDIGFVINFDFPYEPEDYVHRIGRTGRAGASGTAISFADEDESFIIPDIEKYIEEELKCTVLQPDDPLLVKLPEVASGRAPRPYRERPPHAAEHAPRPSSNVQVPASEAPSAPVAKQPSEPAPAAVAAVPAPQPSARVPSPSPSPVAPPAVAPVATPVPVAPEHRREQPARSVVARPAPAEPASQSAAAPARKSRFSEEWVPGQSPR